MLLPTIANSLITLTPLLQTMFAGTSGFYSGYILGNLINSNRPRTGEGEPGDKGEEPREPVKQELMAGPGPEIEIKQEPKYDTITDKNISEEGLADMKPPGDTPGGNVTEEMPPRGILKNKTKEAPKEGDEKHVRFKE